MNTVNDITDVFDVSFNNLRVLRKYARKTSVIRISDLLNILKNTEFTIAKPESAREKYERLIPVIKELQ
jgi:hypothetical protein